MSKARLAAAATVLILLANGCTATDPTRPGSPAPTPHMDVLTAGDMRAFSNVYDALLILRRNWFMARGADAVHQPMVYVDGVLTSGTGMLSGIRPELVRDVTHLPAIDAISRFGPSHGGGAILITTNR